MNTNNKKIFIFFTMLFFASACCKKGVTTYITDPELISAGTFKVGTYYIYRDSISGIEDSVWVDEFITRMIPENPAAYGKKYNSECDDVYETLHLTIKGFNNSTFNYIITNSKLTNSTLNRLVLKPFNEGNIENTHYGNIISENLYTSFSVLGNSYDNVYKIFRKEAIPNSLNNDTLNLRTYYSSHTGLIKYSIKTDTSFVVKELVRSHIVK